MPGFERFFIKGWLNKVRIVKNDCRRFARNTTLRLLLQLLPIVPVLFICFSCNISTDDKHNLAAFQSLDETFAASNAAAATATTIIFHALEAKMYHPAYNKKPGYYHEKAEMIRNVTKNTTAYIEPMKRLLKKQAGFDRPKTN